MIKKSLKKTRTEKKEKKVDNIALPYYIDTLGRQSTPLSLLFALVRIALLFIASSSVILIMVHVYNFPVSDTVVIKSCLGGILGFNILFILLKYRYAFPLLGAAALFLDFEKIKAGAVHFTDIIFIRLDSRLLYTERFATISAKYLENPTDEFLSELAFFITLISCIFCLIVTISARGRFVGAILIAVVIIYIPALGAEIATVTPSLKWAVISMFGLFAVWAGGNYGSENLSVMKITKKRPHKKSFQIAGGVAPLNQYAWNGALAFLAALVSFAFADRLLPDGETMTIIEMFSGISSKMQETFGELGEKISSGFVSFSDDIMFNFNGIDDNGYFHENAISNVSNSVDSLSVTSPSTGLNSVLKVTFEDISEPLYLRNGIGITYNSDKKTWEIPNGESDVKALNALVEEYYPEHNYYIFRRILGALYNNNYEAADLFIGMQRINTEYLAKTKNVMMPTVPYRSLFKNANDYNWNLDTVLQSKKVFSKNETLVWDTLYPRTVIQQLLQQQETIFADFTIDADYDSWDDNNFIANKEDYLRVGGDYYTYINADTLVFGMTSAEYLEKTAEYERLVNTIYTKTDEKERANMERLAADIFNETYITGLTDFDYSARSVLNNKAAAASLITYYLKNYYTYSLTTDNNSGENTLLGNFLFETKSGHCALYATAMTLFMRELGYPARYVTGYVVYPEKAVLTSIGKYECTLLERNLHAWVEVYYEGLGWLPYDPTPSITDEIFGSSATSETSVLTTTTGSMESAETTRRTPLTSDSETTLDITEGTDAEKTEASIPVFVYIIICTAAAVVLLALSIFAFLKSLVKREHKMLARYKRASTRAEAAEMHDFIAKLLGLRKIKAEQGELPSEFAKRVTELLPDTDVDFTIVMDILEKLEFSKESLSEEDYLCISMFAISAYRKTIREKNPFTRLFVRIKLVR